MEMEDRQGDQTPPPHLRSGSSYSFQHSASSSNVEKLNKSTFQKKLMDQNGNNDLQDSEQDDLRQSLAYYHLNTVREDLMKASMISMVDEKNMPSSVRNVLLDREKLKGNLADYQFKLYEKHSVKINDLVRLETLIDITFGKITRVFNKRDRLFYVLKEIKRQEFKKESDFETVVWTEIQNLLKLNELNDPLLVKAIFIDFDEDEETCYILAEIGFGRIQEYAECMKSYGLDWKEEDLEYILSQILSQISKLKQIGMHHRDIKPNNLLIGYNHEGLKFMHYGCACVAKPGVQKLDIAGTPHFMAPELILAIMKQEQVAEYDPYLSDLFSVGMTMLTIIDPEIKRKDAGEILENVVKIKYPGLYPIFKGLLGRPSERNEAAQKFLGKEVHIKSCSEFEAGTLGDKFRVFMFLKLMSRNKQIDTSLYFDMCILDDALIVIKRKLDLLTQDIDPEDQNLEEVIWRIRLARCYYMQKNYPFALKELLEIIQRKELKSFDTENTLVKAKALLWLGVVKEKLGKKTDSIENLMHCLGMRVAEFGEVHRGVAEVFWHLGDLRVGQEDYSGAKKAFSKCIEIGEQLDPKERKYMAKGLYSLGVLAGMRDDYEKALELFEQGKETAIEAHGEFHPAVADQLLAIGYVYVMLGRNEEGVELYKEALATKKRWYGESNPEVADTYTRLAQGYDRMGEYHKALEFLGKSVVIWRKVKGEESQELADVYQLIATVLCKMGNYSKSLEFANKVISSKEKFFGKNHPWLAEIYAWHGIICFILGLEKQKKKSLEALLAIDFDQLELNVNNIKTGFRTAALLAEDGNVEKGWEYFQKAYQMCINLAVAKNTQTYACYYEAMGRLRKAEGRYEEALEDTKTALHIRESLPGKDPDIEARIYSTMGDLYEFMNNNQEALRWRRRSMELVERYLSKGGLLMLKTLITLSRALQKMGKHEEARGKLNSAQQLIKELGISKGHPLFEECLEIQNSLEGRQSKI